MLRNGREDLVLYSQRETKSLSEIKMASVSKLKKKNNPLFLVWKCHIACGNLYHGPWDSVEVPVMLLPPPISTFGWFSQPELYSTDIQQFAATNWNGDGEN